MHVIRNNFGLKVLSLLIAILGWAYFRYAGSPIALARFNQELTVPISTVNLAPDLIARYADKSAVITVVPKPGDAPVKAGEIKAVLDLSNRNAGVYNIPVQLVAPNVAVQSLSPASVTLTIAKIDQKTFPLALHYGGSKSVVVSHVAMTPANAVVRGPTDELSQIATVRVDVPLDQGKKGLDAMIRPVAVNAAGQPIADLQVVPNLVRVQAQFLPAR